MNSSRITQICKSNLLHIFVDGFRKNSIFSEKNGPWNFKKNSRFSIYLSRIMSEKRPFYWNEINAEYELSEAEISFLPYACMPTESMPVLEWNSSVDEFAKNTCQQNNFPNVFKP